MNHSRSLLLALAGCALAVPGLHAATTAKSDLLPTHKRQITVDTGELLTHRPAPPPLPADLASPFNPTDFDKPDGADAAVAHGGGAPVKPGTAPAAPAAAPGDRETLETLAAQINPSGTVIAPGGKPLLIIGKRPFAIGTNFTATYNNQEYELELVAIDRTTFTLRYRNEEITRPIKSAR